MNVIDEINTVGEMVSRWWWGGACTEAWEDSVLVGQDTRAPSP